MGIVNVNLPATDAWKELMKQRTSHNLKGLMGNDGENMNIEDVKLLYKLSEDGEYATLCDVYEEGMETEGGIVVPLSSTYRGIREVLEKTRIVNVAGSSNDTVGNTNYKIGWLVIYKFITGIDTNICCTDGYEYSGDDNIDNNMIWEREVDNCNANTRDENCMMHGGHVIIGYNKNGVYYAGAKYCNAEKPTADDIVAIMPICAAHNNHWKNDSYMIVGKNTPAVVLNYTLGRKVFKDYIK